MASLKAKSEMVLTSLVTTTRNKNTVAATAAAATTRCSPARRTLPFLYNNSYNMTVASSVSSIHSSGGGSAINRADSGSDASSIHNDEPLRHLSDGGDVTDDPAVVTVQENEQLQHQPTPVKRSGVKKQSATIVDDDEGDLKDSSTFNNPT